MTDSSISVEGLIDILKSGSLSVSNFSLVTSRIILPEYHDAVWVALDNNEITVGQVNSITDFVVRHPEVAKDTDIRVACLLFFMVAWNEYRSEDYRRAHQGAEGALGIIKKYAPAKELLNLLHGHVEQSRVPRLTLNEAGRVNPIKPNDPEELEINPKWL